MFLCTVFELLQGLLSIQNFYYWPRTMPKRYFFCWLYSVCSGFYVSLWVFLVLVLDGETVDFSGRRENYFTFSLFLTHIYRIKRLCCSTTCKLILTELHGNSWYQSTIHWSWNISPRDWTARTLPLQVMRGL